MEECYHVACLQHQAICVLRMCNAQVGLTEF